MTDDDAFSELWHFVINRDGVIVQKKDELEQIYKLMEGCQTYLEIGTAGGDSMYCLSHALKNRPSITFVDYGEEKIAKKRDEVINIIKTRGVNVRPVYGCSHLHSTIKEAAYFSPYDCVLIDAGHSYADVIADATAYGGMAKKYIFFHDILMKEVRAAFDWYVETHGYKNVSHIFCEGSEYGFGVIKL